MSGFPTPGMHSFQLAGVLSSLLHVTVLRHQAPVPLLIAVKTFLVNKDHLGKKNLTISVFDKYIGVPALGAGGPVHTFLQVLRAHHLSEH